MEKDVSVSNRRVVVEKWYGMKNETLLVVFNWIEEQYDFRIEFEFRGSVIKYGNFKVDKFECYLGALEGITLKFTLGTILFSSPLKFTLGTILFSSPV